MKYLYVGGTPEVDRDALTAVRERIAAEFHAPALGLELPGIDFAFDPGRQQFGSIPVLEMVSRLCPKDGHRLLAVTERDLYVPVLTFVYGQAQLNGRSAVMSFARLRQEFYGLAPNREVFLERACKEAMHELGHTYGLVHCSDRMCTMALGTNIGQIDRKRAGYCNSCAGRLRRRQGSE